MDPRSRAAVIRRISAVLGNDKPAPNTWAELNTTEQLLLEANDPEVAQILRGQMSPELEIATLTGKLSETFTGQSPEQVQAAQREAALAAAEASMAAQLEALNQHNAAMAQAREAARQESLLMAQAQQIATARSNFMGA